MGSLSERRNTFLLAVQELPKTDVEFRSPAWRQERRKRGWVVADRGGSISDFAHVEGVATQTMVQWLKSNDTELHRALGDAAHPMTLSREKRLERLLAVRKGLGEHKRVSEIAADIGLSKNRLYYWLRLWAPDGVEQAIEDETFDEDEVAA